MTLHSRLRWKARHLEPGGDNVHTIDRKAALRNQGVARVLGLVIFEARVKGSEALTRFHSFQRPISMYR